MKKSFLTFILLSISLTNFSQNTQKNQGFVENEKGKKITNKDEEIEFLSKIKVKKQNELTQLNIAKTTQAPVELCTNNGFEQHESINGSLKLKNFLHTIGDPPGPTQCNSITNTADSYIDIYNPNNMSIMATTVPANLIDPYIGNINAFDQYALKINYENSYTYGSIVQSKRFKTNNENYLKFNYKAVLMTVYDNGHTDNQPFVKARIINSANVVVSEFCLVGDESNCIFTKIPGSDAAILYTQNWQSGLLNISSIPNNEEFTVEFMASRCGFGGHFGYMYLDDMCLLHSNENLQGSIELNPLYKVCSNLPINVCGSYSVPNSGGITASLGTLTLNLYNSSGNSIYSSTTPSSLDTTNQQFCFELNSTNFPNVLNANYNVGVTATYNVTGNSTPCGGTVFDSANDPDANSGWDISFQNCSTSCNFEINTTKLSLCDNNHDGQEIFNLSNANSNIVSSIIGFTFSYFTNFNDANSNLNVIANTSNYNSTSKTIFVRVSQSPTCYKIIAIDLEVKNPNVNISGILNVCSGSTTLTATSGASYLWNNGATTQSINISTIGTYSVTVTDSNGCYNTASVAIEPTQTATTPNVTVTQPSCLSSTGTIQVTSPASEYSFDNGNTWTTNPTITNLYPNTYKVKIKTINNCISYAIDVVINPSLTSYPSFTYTNPAFCGGFGSITITTQAAFYSFDDGVTWVTNPIASNLPLGSYKIRTKDDMGCISNFNTVLLSLESLETPNYTIINPACGVNGSITINTISDFYTFDGGATWVTNNTLTNLTTGSYSIAIKNSLGCTSAYSNAYINDLQDLTPVVSIVQPICGSGGSIAITSTANFYSFDSGATWTTNNIATNLPPGNYEIKIKNANGCVSQLNYVTLYVPSLDAPIITVVQPQCGINGSITVNTLSDFYSYDGGTTWITSNTISLPEGNYVVMIKNSLGCTSNYSYLNLYAPTLPNPSYTTVQPTCANTGSITISTPYPFYSIDGGINWSTNPVFTNLAGGNYYIMIKNSLGCTSTSLYVNLNTNYLAEPTYTYTNPSCGNIGNITFTSAATFYSINNGTTWSTSPVFNNLSSGSYSLIVKNTAGCISNEYSVYLDSTTLNNPNVSLIYPCNGSTGSITITTLAASYSIDGGATWSNNSVFTNLTSGYYYVKIKNGSGCESETSYVYFNSSLPNPQYTSIQPVCGTNGSITITTTAAFYSVDGGTTWTTTPTFNNLNAGYYQLTIKNSAGCISSSQYIYLQQAYIPEPTFTVTQPTCGVGGTITITTTASQYSINGGSSWQTSPTFSNLSAASYSISIKNSLGCVSQVTYAQVESYYLTNPNITIVQPTCGNNGSITIATSASQYSFDGGNTWTTNSVLSNIVSGYYNVMIKNSQGCTSSPYTMNVTIHDYYLQPPLVSAIQPSCGNNGSITILTNADFYSFDNGTTWTTNNVFNNPPSGYYNVKIKNNLGCISTYESVHINTFYLPNPIVTTIQPSCSSPFGTINVETVADQYSFNDGTTWITNPMLTNLTTGSYIIKIKNSQGCESQSTYTYIYNPPTIPNAPSFSSTQPSLCGTTDGSITITTSASQYSFNNGVTWTSNPTKINLASGTYYIKTKNGNNCESAATIVNLNSGTTIAAPTLSVASPGCSNQFGSITVTTPAAYYSFDNGITFVSSNTKSNLLPGTYNIKIKSIEGCISLSSSATIQSLENLPAPTISITQPNCLNSTGSITVTTNTALYSFDNGVTFSSSNILTGLTTGNYSVIVKDASGCTSTASLATINSQPSIPNAPTINVISPINCNTSTGTITVTSNGAQFSFDNGTTWNNNNTSIPLSPGTYQVRIKETLTGCESNPTIATISTPPNAPATPTFVITQPISCVNPFGSISITSSEFQYSFDNGITYSNNPNSGALAVGTYLIKVKNASNCESNYATAIINLPSDYPTTPMFSIIQPDCNNSNGQINISSVSNEYSIDNGITWSSNPTFSNLSPSNYQIKIKNLLGCVSQANVVATISTFTDFTIQPTAVSPQTFCIQQNATLNNIVISGQNIKWYDSLTSGNLIPNTSPLTDGLTYYATQTINGCESLRISIVISIQNTNAPSGTANQTMCATTNPTLNSILLSGTQINWYASNTSTSVLSNSTLLVNGATYYATQTVNGCESINRFAVTITLINSLNANDYLQAFCDDLNDGSENVILSDYNTNLTSSTNNITFTYYSTFNGAENQIINQQINPNYTLSIGTNIIYVRLDSSNGCHKTVKLELDLFKKPIILIDDVIPICKSTNIIVNAGTGFNSYFWSTGATTPSISITNAGTYSVTVTKNYGLISCSATKTFNVVISEVPTITNIQTEDWTDVENIIIVSTAINDNYQYSLDGINYQTSNTFTGLLSGFYTIYVKDECGISKEDVVLLNYPKFFTPNDDGYNDYWKIKFSQYETNLKTTIYDRYGKIIKIISANSPGWDGTYNSKKLISDDYWFVVKRDDGREHRGHFTLKR